MLLSDEEREILNDPRWEGSMARASLEARIALDNFKNELGKVFPFKQLRTLFTRILNTL
jgi:hypothetical protein